MNEWIWNVKTMHREDAVLTVSRIEDGSHGFIAEGAMFGDNDEYKSDVYRWHVQMRYCGLAAKGTAHTDTEACERAIAAANALRRANAIMSGAPLDESTT